MVKAFMEGSLPLYLVGPTFRDEIIAEIERLEFDNKFWSSAAEAHRLKGWELDEENAKLREALDITQNQKESSNETSQEKP